MAPVEIVHRASAVELQSFLNKNGDAGKKDRKDRVQRYVPHLHVPSAGSLDDIADLINRSQRFYLRPVDDHAKSAAALDSSLAGNDDNDDDSVNDFHIFDINKVEKSSSVLDLGTVALQRIVTQMKGLRYDVQESVYVKDAAKLGGLKRYGDYVKGVPKEDEIPTFGARLPLPK